MRAHPLGARHQDGGIQGHLLKAWRASCGMAKKSPSSHRDISHLPKKKKVNLYHRTVSLGAYVQVSQTGQDANPHSTILAV